MDTVVVVPSIREPSLQAFLRAWRAELMHIPVVLIEDNPERSFDCPSEYTELEHYSWKEIDACLGNDAWVIPRRTDCIRSFGYLRALELGAEMIVTLDDDCYPVAPGFLATHEQCLNKVGGQAWVNTVTGSRPRGLPYFSSERHHQAVVSHGLWTNVPDFDGPTQLLATSATSGYRPALEPVVQVVPRGQYYPMCGMNLAFRRIIVPAMYFLLMGHDYPYDRFGDIWAGIFSKRVCDHLGYAVTSGAPLVRHDRASVVWANLRKELPGLEVNEELWRHVDDIVLSQRDVVGCYSELASGLAAARPGEYWIRLTRAMVRWAELAQSRM